MLLKPNIQIPKWDPLYLTNPYLLNAAIFDSSEEDMSAVAMDSSDHFRMFEFKIRTCPRGRSHDWTKCPYVHPGEKARRRDPRLFQYSGTECPDSRQGNNTCRKGDSCEFSHGVFESWLHPDRYRTQPCRDGISCRRRVCFFAHTSEQLRIPKIPGDELVSLMKNVQLGSGSGYGSPRVSTRNSGYGVEEEEPVMERVESGRDLRAKMYAKLMKDNSLERVRSYQPMISAGSWS